MASIGLKLLRFVGPKLVQSPLAIPRGSHRISVAEVATAAVAPPLPPIAIVEGMSTEQRAEFSRSPPSRSLVQLPAPNFTGVAVIANDFRDICLADMRGRYIVLIFYPMDFTFVCPTELIAYSERIKEFTQLKTEVIGVSTDSHFSHLAWLGTPRKKGGLGTLNFPLMADFSKRISRDYGVLLEDVGVALRGLFLIDGKGIVRHMCVNDLSVGRSVDETLRLVKAFQFVEQHGEVCPVNWNPDTPTIKPTPKGSKEYFEKQDEA